MPRTRPWPSASPPPWTVPVAAASPWSSRAPPSLWPWAKPPSAPNSPTPAMGRCWGWRCPAPPPGW
ncbi:hypothetical protein HML84_19585 [Alcanivorax sp. IO_7]|nr:hypothetical protein HML84_19585 [Alcanivorax sp. IO_7]